MFSAIVEDEEVAKKDRKLALALGGGRMSSVSASVPEVSHIESLPPSRSQTSSPGPSFIRRTKQTECVSCAESHRCIATPCGDFYCADCLRQVFVMASVDEELYPPRCCRQEIPLSIARPYLSDEDLSTFNSKSEEYSSKKRIYCFRPTCSAFIPAANITGDSARCPMCDDDARTCTICKREAHNGDCPEDTELELTLQTAAKNGWQRCHSCFALVERSHGCQHMT